MSHQIAKPKIDYVFKQLFGTEKNIHLLRYFLGIVLDLPETELKRIELLPTEKIREYEGDKSSFFDISARINGEEKINIEIQVVDELNMVHRSLYYWSNMYAKEMKKGMNYNELNKCVCINVLDFNQTNSKELHSVYHIREDKRNIMLTDLLEMHFIELPNINRSIMLGDDMSELEKLARFLDAETEEELDMLSDTSAALKEAAEVVYDIKNNDMSWAEYIAREKYILEKNMNQNVLIAHYKKVGIEEGRAEGRAEGIDLGATNKARDIAKKMLASNMPIEMIAEITGLSQSEILSIK